MTIKPVVQKGEGDLEKPSTDVVANDFHSAEMEVLLQDMLDTMLETQGIGIAAPQIGVNLRVIIFGGASDRYPGEEPFPLTKLINPTYKVLDETLEEGWEGCLSVKGVRGLVPRYKKIVYTGYDVEQKTLITREASGFHARVVQHECDHLEGKLFVSRVKNEDNLRHEDQGPLRTEAPLPSPKNDIRLT